jgi:ribosomal protein S27E
LLLGGSPELESGILSPILEDNASDMGFGFNARPDVNKSIPMGDLGNSLSAAEESSVLGGNRHGEPRPSLSFGFDASSDPADGPSGPLPSLEFEEGSGGDEIEAFKLPEASMSAQSPAEPESKPASKTAGLQPSPASEKGRRGESGATTVLIRYTCPKCKNQGMQAVDKVGTVVHCANCGKAMRLVMKK